MIRYINCFRKLPELSDEDFRDYWQGAEFGDLLKQVGDLTGALRYTRSLTLKVNMGEELLTDRGLSQPYDGILEYYWESASHLPKIYASPEARELSERMAHFQADFIDLAHSTAFFTEHND